MRKIPAKLLGASGLRVGACHESSAGGGMTSHLAPSLFTLTEYARQNRKTPTASEALLWNALRDRRFRGIKFRRQHVLAPFIVDFYAPALKLVVEIDGGYHAERVAEDAAREAVLVRVYGVRVVRFAIARPQNPVFAAVWAPKWPHQNGR